LGYLFQDQLVKYLNERVKSLPYEPTNPKWEAHRYLFILLRILAQHSGNIATGDTKDLREALLQKPTDNMASGWGLALADTPTLPPSELRRVLGEVQDLLLRGKKPEALKITISNQLWAHALLISSSLSPKDHSETIAAFVKATMPESSPLKSLYLAIAGKGQSLLRSV